MTDATDRPSDDPMTAARELRLDACLGEALGQRPGDGFAARLGARLASTRPTRSWPFAGGQRLAAAALLLLGAGAVVGVWYASRQDVGRSARAQDPHTQDPQKKDERKAPAPSLDDVTGEEIERMIRDLELPDRAGAAIAELAAMGGTALPSIDRALAAETLRGRQRLLDALWYARAQAVDDIALRAFLGDAAAAGRPYTLISDYSDNLVGLVDGKGRVVAREDDMFGAWDAELTAQGTMLVTQFSVSKIVEFGPDGREVWSYDDLKNPYDADRLPNGNTLIADTFGSRVVEVNPARQVVWQYDTQIRPFDCDRLANGNTLIADVLEDRVLEVTPAGDIAWEVRGMNNAHDADRLANGNTLITLRSRGTVLEVDRDGKTVWELTGLSSPSDADRLPNGNTLVAENTQVREFDAQKQVVWRQETTWAVEAHRY